jgi:hypothetical protein
MRLRSDKETGGAASSQTESTSSIKKVWRKLRGVQKTDTRDNEKAAMRKTSYTGFAHASNSDEQLRNSEGKPVFWVRNGYRHTNNPLTVEQWSTFFEQEKGLQHSREYISNVKQLFDVPPTSLQSLAKRVREQEKTLRVWRRENFGEGVFVRVEELANPGVSFA